MTRRKGNDEAELSMHGDYYRAPLALVHHRGFGSHADLCAPGILRLVEPIRARSGLVVELGCGSGRLTRHLIDAGHRVLATDGSPSMVALARQSVPEADVRQLVLPGDPIPEADAIVSVGHVLNYLADEPSIERAWMVIARALRPGGVLALDVCDLEWGTARADAPTHALVTEDWAIITRFSRPAPRRFVRDISVFVRETSGCWRRDDECHHNVLLETSSIPSSLAMHGVAAGVSMSFGAEELPVGLRAIIGTRR
jgi:SAM-dependent methyltransferase